MNIATGIQMIQMDTSGLDYNQFVGEEQVKESVYTNLQMVGEAAYELAKNDDEILGLNFDTDLLAGFRNARYNEEAEIDHHSVWGIIQNDLETIRLEALDAAERLQENEENQL